MLPSKITYQPSILALVLVAFLIRNCLCQTIFLPFLINLLVQTLSVLLIQHTPMTYVSDNQLLDMMLCLLAVPLLGVQRLSLLLLLALPKFNSILLYLQLKSVSLFVMSLNALDHLLLVLQ